MPREAVAHTSMSYTFPRTAQTYTDVPATVTAGHVIYSRNGTSQRLKACPAPARLSVRYLTFLYVYSPLTVVVLNLTLPLAVICFQVPSPPARQACLLV